MPSKCNVIHFLSKHEINELYFARTQKYLQPEFISYNFMADTADAFNEITKHPDSKWDILVTDADRLKTDRGAIEAFLTAKSSCKAVVVGTRENDIVDIPRTVFKPFPSDVDHWLEMMRALLTR